MRLRDDGSLVLSQAQIAEELFSRAATELRDAQRHPMNRDVYEHGATVLYYAAVAAAGFPPGWPDYLTWRDWMREALAPVVEGGGPAHSTTCASGAA